MTNDDPATQRVDPACGRVSSLIAPEFLTKVSPRFDCNSKFIELETLGSLEQIITGSFSWHREVWRIVDNPFTKLNSMAVMDFIDKDKMADVCRNMLKKE